MKYGILCLLDFNGMKGDVFSMAPKKSNKDVNIIGEHDPIAKAMQQSKRLDRAMSDPIEIRLAAQAVFVIWDCLSLRY